MEGTERVLTGTLLPAEPVSPESVTYLSTDVVLSEECPASCLLLQERVLIRVDSDRLYSQSPPLILGGGVSSLVVQPLSVIMKEGTEATVPVPPLPGSVYYIPGWLVSKETN